MQKLSINLTDENYKKLLERKGKSGASISWQINDLLHSVFLHLEEADKLWVMKLQLNCSQQVDINTLDTPVKHSSDG